MTLVLASTSKYRARLLERFGEPFLQVDPRLDESPWHHRGAPAGRLVRELSEAKARAACEQPACPEDAVVIGSDQTGEIDGQLLHKPGSIGRAVEQLMLMSGREHRLWTGVAVYDRARQRMVTHVDVCRLVMRAFSEAEARAYVERWMPLDCAGSYRIEDAGILLFDRVHGDDPTAIEGLPLMALGALLRRIRSERTAS